MDGVPVFSGLGVLAFAVYMGLSEIATATGLNRMTLSKILNQKGYSTATDTIDRLCTYFECQVADLLDHVPESSGDIGDASI